MQEHEIELIERLTGQEPGKGVPAKYLDAYERARFAMDRLGQPAFTPNELVLVGLAAGVLPHPKAGTLEVIPKGPPPPADQQKKAG